MSSRLLVGIGSANGDDRVGWLVAQHLAQIDSESIDTRCAQAPADLLDWLDGVGHLELVDGVRCDALTGTLHEWRWPAPEIETAHYSGSHDLSLPAVLQLAEQLGQLPRHVRVWGITIEQARPLTSLSPPLADALPTIVGTIAEAVRASDSRLS